MSTEQKQDVSKRVIEKGLNISRSRTIAYWVATVALVVELGLRGMWNLLQIPYVRELMEHLGYPAFLTYTGAVASHLAVGDGADAIAAPIIFAGLTLASWVLCPSDRRALAPS